MTLTLGGFSLVAYVVNLNQIFLYVSDPNVLFGFRRAPGGASFSNGALNGMYAGYATNPATFAVTVFSGEFSADGATPTGNMTGTEDIGAPTGAVLGPSFQSHLLGNPIANKRQGNMTVSSGTGGNAVIYIDLRLEVCGAFAERSQSRNPGLRDPSTPASVSVSSLSLNPTTVTGGNSSTGTVTLSGPAPTGGAQVTLSNSNTTVARVPSSVTVAAGATSASSLSATSAVAVSTTVTISASYGGATRSATLTVTPAPPPAPMLSSLTLKSHECHRGNSSRAQSRSAAPHRRVARKLRFPTANTTVAGFPPV